MSGLLDYLPLNVQEMLKYDIERIPPRKVSPPMTGEAGELLEALHAVFVLRNDWEKYELSKLVCNIAKAACVLEEKLARRYRHDWDDMALDINLAHPDEPYGRSWYIRAMWEVLTSLMYNEIGTIRATPKTPEETLTELRRLFPNARKHFFFTDGGTK